MNLKGNEGVEKIINVLRALSEKRVEEAVEFIEYLYQKELHEMKTQEQFTEESKSLSEGDLHNYLQELEDYEDLLAQGKIQWK
jgi:predicted type IV restriction endonuclease